MIERSLVVAFTFIGAKFLQVFTVPRALPKTPPIATYAEVDVADNPLSLVWFKVMVPALSFWQLVKVQE